MNRALEELFAAPLAGGRTAQVLDDAGRVEATVIAAAPPDEPYSDEFDDLFGSESHDASPPRVRVASPRRALQTARCSKPKPRPKSRPAAAGGGRGGRPPSPPRGRVPGDYGLDDEQPDEWDAEHMEGCEAHVVADPPELHNVHGVLHTIEEANTEWVPCTLPADAADAQSVAAEEEAEGFDADAPCALCALPDSGPGMASELAAVYEYERQHFGSMPDDALFGQIAQLFNERVAAGAAAAGLPRPPEWSKCAVRHHLMTCVLRNPKRLIATDIRTVGRMQKHLESHGVYRQRIVCGQPTGEIVLDARQFAQWRAASKHKAELADRLAKQLAAEAAASGAAAAPAAPASTSSAARAAAAPPAGFAGPSSGGGGGGGGGGGSARRGGGPGGPMRRERQPAHPPYMAARGGGGGFPTS